MRAKDLLSYKFNTSDLATLTGLFVCMAILFSWSGKLFWGFDLFSSFLLHYSIILSICVVILAVKKKWFRALVCMVFLTINTLELVPFYLPHENDIVTSHKVRVMQSNVLSRNNNYGLLSDYVEKVDPDILLLEEVTPEWLVNIPKIFDKYPFTKLCARSDNFGIALFSKYPLENVSIQQFVAHSVPSIVCDINVNGTLLHFVGTHPLPPIGLDYATERNKQMNVLASHCFGIVDRPVVVLGDLNMSHWSVFYKLFEEQSGLRNSSYGFGLQLSWPAVGPLMILSTPIDHCLVNNKIIVNDRFVGDFIGSDHFPIIVDISF